MKFAIAAVLLAGTMSGCAVVPAYYGSAGPAVYIGPVPGYYTYPHYHYRHRCRYYH